LKAKHFGAHRRQLFINHSALSVDLKVRQALLDAGDMDAPSTLLPNINGGHGV
jgi:hypothetical protein